MGGSRFDTIQKNMVTKVNSLYGYRAVWVPTDLSGQQVAQILFKDPTREKDISGLVEYDPKNIYAEFKIGDFPGLRDLANAADSQEQMSIEETDATRLYYVRQVNLKYDGKTCIAVLERVNDSDIDLDETLNDNFKDGD